MSKFYFDIDNTITITEVNPANLELTIGEQVYSAAEPLMERIAEVNRLYDDGHIITYWTARGTVTGFDYTELTKNQLDSWGAKYHELKMGKPDFDYLIDDKAVNTEDWFRPLRVGLVINNLIRDYLSRLIEVYVKYSTPKDAKEPNMPIEPINPYKLEDSFILPDDEFENIYAWMYHGAALEIFGGANQTQSNLLQRLSLFQSKIYDKLILLSRESTRSKFATFSFLAKNQCDLNEIIFVGGYEDYWKNVDVLITDNPEILKVKPTGKTAVVLKNKYNTEYHAIGYGINSPSELFKLPIFKLKPITKEEMIYFSAETPEGVEDDKLLTVDQVEVENAKPVDLNLVKVTMENGSPVIVDFAELRDKINIEDGLTKSDNNAI